MHINIFNFLNPEILIHSLGYAGIFSNIFIESGFFFGFFLPGDTLLFTVGFLASSGLLSIWISLVGIIVATYLGGIVGYLFGKKVGPKIFTRERSFFFNPKNLDRTRVFYQKYGKWTVVFSHFIPFARTFAPILAGVGEMDLGDFLKFNILGSVLWPVVVISVGYFFGRQFPAIHRFVMPAILGCFLLTLVPIFWGMYQEYKKEKD